MAPRSLPRGVAKTRSVTRLWRNPRDCLRKKMRAYRKLPRTRGDQVYAILPTHVSPPRHALQPLQSLTVYSPIVVVVSRDSY